MTDQIVVVVLAFVACVFLFIALSAVLKGAEKVSPRFAAWMDSLDEPRDRGF